MNQKTTIINLFGGPGLGKSTTAAGLFYDMKKSGHVVELVTEFAKDLTWEGHNNLLEDQLYLLANQNRRISRLIGKVDFVVTDCPILLGLAYYTGNSDSFVKFNVELFNSYRNINFLLKRLKPYVQIGRSQSEQEAKDLDVKIKNLLDTNGIKYAHASEKEIFDMFQVAKQIGIGFYD